MSQKQQQQQQAYERIPLQERVEIAMEMLHRKDSHKTVIDIAKEHNISRKHCYKLEQKHQTIHDLSDLPRSGRPKKVTPHLERRIMREVEKYPFESSFKMVKKINTGLAANEMISARTLRHYTILNGMRCCRPAIKPSLKPHHVKDRLAFAKRLVDKDMRYWGKVLFTDETKVELFPRDRRDRVRRPRHRRNDARYTVRSRNFESGSLMFWGSIHYKGVGELLCVRNTLDAEGYVNILEMAIPEIKRKFNISSFIFQDDNNPIHRNNSVIEYKESEGIRCLENWPAMSPDLNPIENLWSIWKSRIRERGPLSLERLKEIAFEEWAKIPNELVQKLFHSVPKRMEEVIKAHGYGIKY